MPRTEQFDARQAGVTETCCTCCGDVRPCIFTADPVEERLVGNSLLPTPEQIYFCKPCWTERKDYDGE